MLFNLLIIQEVVPTDFSFCLNVSVRLNIGEGELSASTPTTI